MTIVVDDLERQGLVERKPHPTDRRAKLVETTPLGHKAASRAREIMNCPPAELSALPEAELEALVRGLRAIRPYPSTPVIGLPEDRIPPPKR
jgi:DNA-binding MarR family transcriptional regulator